LTCNCCATNPHDEGACLRIADADGAVVAGEPAVADIDIAIARGEIKTGISAQGDVAAAGCVVGERSVTVGRVAVAGGVAKKR